MRYENEPTFDHDNDPLAGIKEQAFLLERIIDAAEKSKLPAGLIYISPEGEETHLEIRTASNEFLATAKYQLEKQRSRIDEYERLLND